MSCTDYLERFLVPYWLRPESALWYAHEAAIVRPRLPSPLPERSLELGCMDGITSYVMLGGAFDPAFDVYSELDASVAEQRSYKPGDDYFDRRREDAASDIRGRAPRDRFGVGLTWKDRHAEAARELGIHGEVVVDEREAGLSRFDDGEFELVWGPNLYWLDKLEETLAEIRRVLRPDGRLVTVLPDGIAPELMLGRLAGRFDRGWIESLDRGRHANVSRQARRIEEWHELFERVGLAVADHEPYLPSVVLRVHDIGLRPLFPVLIEVYQCLPREDLLAVKGHWNELAMELLAPLCRREYPPELGVVDVWHLFELTPA